MKQAITKLALIFGCTAHYSGKTQTMYIKGERREEVIQHLMITGVNPPFTVNAGEVSIKASVLDLSNISETFTEQTEPTALNTAEVEADGSTLEVLLQLDDEQRRDALELAQAIDEEIRHYSKSLDKDELRKALDHYLTIHPVDRNQKGCYNHAADLFGVKTEYVRDRYRKLREKGIIND